MDDKESAFVLGMKVGATERIAELEAEVERLRGLIMNWAINSDHNACHCEGCQPLANEILSGMVGK